MCASFSLPLAPRDTHAPTAAKYYKWERTDADKINANPRRPPPSAEFSPTTPPRFVPHFLLLLEQEHRSRHGLLHSIAQIFSWPSEGIPLAVRYGCAAVHRLSVYEACIPMYGFLPRSEIFCWIMNEPARSARDSVELLLDRGAIYTWCCCRRG